MTHCQRVGSPQKEKRSPQKAEVQESHMGALRVASTPSLALLAAAQALLYTTHVSK